MKKVAIYGAGNLGKALIYALHEKGFFIYDHAYNAEGSQEEHLKLDDREIEIVNSDLLRNDVINNCMREFVDCIVVTLPGKALEEEIDFLLEFKIPLIIMSTQYDVEKVTKKLQDSGISAVISENMCFGIVDFWKRLTGLPKLKDDILISIDVVESHPEFKADISGSAIKVLEILKDKGFQVDFSKQDREAYKDGVDGYYGCIHCLRDKTTQESYGVPEEYLMSHAYHSYFFNVQDSDEKSIAYLNQLYHIFIAFVRYNIPGVFEFEVELNDNSLDLTHNINGREIYADGVARSIEYLDVHKGVFTGIDVISAN